MADTFEERAAEALIENELTAPTGEDLYLRTLLLLKSLQAPGLTGKLSPEKVRISCDHLKGLLLLLEPEIGK